MNGKKTSLRIALVAVFTAVVAVFTIAVRIPTPTTGGYISLCDVAVTFTAYAFGPITGLIAGGLGTACADLIGGYPQWAAISFVVHGLEALLIGLVVKGSADAFWKKALGVVIAALTVAFGYFLLTGLFLESFSTAAVEIGPNLIQGGVGGVLGLALYAAVSKGYRKLDTLRW